MAGTFIVVYGSISMVIKLLSLIVKRFIEKRDSPTNISKNGKDTIYGEHGTK
jgi:hypothetical protein